MMNPGNAYSILAQANVGAMYFGSQEQKKRAEREEKDNKEKLFFKGQQAEPFFQQQQMGFGSQMA